jgi:hypothetical protein
MAEKLNPNFDDLPDPASTIINHFDNLFKKGGVKNSEVLNPFPVEIFPEAIQEIICATNECINFPIDFIGSSMLFAISVAIGNTHKVEIKKGWQENGVIYLSIVARPGTNKSHPLSWTLKPIERRDALGFQIFQRDKQEYDNLMSLSKKERGEKGSNEPIKPVWEQLLVTDFTPEALAVVLKSNMKGIGVYADELASWFNNFNRYNKGSEEQFWLSVWSGKPIRINRKTSDPIFIELPFISVAGTIQPAVLNALAANRTENGFLDRLLFVVLDDLKKEYWSEVELNPRIAENWNNIISKLLDLSVLQDETNTLQPEILKFSPEAKTILFDWQRKLTDESNNPENEAMSGIYAKMEMYAARLALCLEMMRFACGESDKKNVGIEAVQGAIKLVEYFKKTAFKVHSIISNASPLDKLPRDKQAVYKALPDTFKTSEGVQVAENMGMAERTFKRFLSNRELFNNHTRGEYEKRY